ncbi:hypothetical protein [uncultured Desulfobacter sp.]|uniref:hypothetical protein n=1 Tax=uncultured Desulfobacter sp. TaxID=240139 RepID=UPI0029F5442D|nr:hypothetical protein [uncultured Desulfobacter sp.]
MNIECIHIGMPKTATTYLQNVWFQDPAYCLSYLGCSPLVTQIHKIISTGKGMNEPVTVRTDKTYVEGQKVIISNEGFSTPFMNADPETQKKAYSYISLCSESLRKYFPNCQNILLTIREPKAWIKSMYTQGIKMGSHGSCQEFVDINELFLKASFDLRYLVNEFRKKFNNVIVLPYEMLKENKDQFWEVWSCCLDLPIPRPLNSSEKFNVSPGDKRIYWLSQINSQCSKVFKTLINSPSYQKNVKLANLKTEWEALNNSYLNTNKWVHRRFAEYANDSQINEMYEMLNMSFPEKTFFDFTIGADLKFEIKKNFIDFLKKENLIKDNYVKQYEANLSE